MNRPNVSIVIPCYNVEKTLRKCLDSVVGQTLQNIEIICVNDGSKDSTLSILQEYAARDSRIHIIDKPNGGYGESMNRGFDAATGEYLGIVESDDFAEPDMFEKLYTCAAENNLDIARAGFFHYVSQPEESDTPVACDFRFSGKEIFCPSEDFRNKHQMASFFSLNPAIWSGIYRREMIVSNHIRFNETPGASYQDMGFFFKTCMKARRMKVIREYLLHYRIDNAFSSVHSPGKVYCVCDEHMEMCRFLEEETDKAKELLPLLVRVKYQSYLWNYERLSPELQEKFILRFRDEFAEHQKAGVLDRMYFLTYDWYNLQKIILDPMRYHRIALARSRGEAAEDFYDAYPEYRPVRGKRLYWAAEKAALARKLLYEQGMIAAVHQALTHMKRNKEDNVGAGV